MSVQRSEMVRLTDDPLEPSLVERLVRADDRGAVLAFVGLVRDHTGPHRVERLEYEAYRPMAVKVFEGIRAEVDERWPGTRVAIHHRLGHLAVGEVAVVIAVAAPHRAETFDACRYAIERMKADVPIFKKEVRTDGSVWVGLGS